MCFELHYVMQQICGSDFNDHRQVDHRVIGSHDERLCGGTVSRTKALNTNYKIGLLVKFEQ